MAKIGRKTKLTPELKEEIVKYIKAGMFAKDACQIAGICESTYYNWIERGEKEEEPFLEFLESIKKARAKAIMRNVLLIQKAAKETWQAAAWWLERVAYKDWGKKTQVGGFEEASPIKIKITKEELVEKLIKKFDDMRERFNANKGNKQ